MFTGLVRDVGEVIEARRNAREAVLVITTKLPAPLARGASICCDGVCLTVTESGKGQFTVQASSETLSRTTLGDWQKGRRVNLEPSLRLGDELGGHLVFGHVDGCGECASREAGGESLRLGIRMTPEIAPYVAVKGSIAVDGVSLTVNGIEGDMFFVTIIPHTLAHTSLGALKPGARVNLEIDMLARYVARLAGFMQKAA